MDDADLGAEGEDAVLGELPAAGAQAVAIEAGGDAGAVGHDQGGGAVPGLAEAGVELVEGLQLGGGAGVNAIGAGHQHGEGMSGTAAAQDKEFQRLVQAGGV